MDKSVNDFQAGSGAIDSPPSLRMAEGCATLCLHRPGRHNCLSGEDILVFERHLAEVESDLSVRVLIVAATGTSFCSGYDLRQLGAGGARGVPAFDRLTDALEALRVPTICALSGGVYGGGTDLALACDFRIGVPDSAFGMTASRIGIHYYHGGLARYVRTLGLSAAKRLFLFANIIDSEEMLRLGILDEVVTADELQSRVATLAHTLSANAPFAVQGMKRALNRIAAGDTSTDEANKAWQASLRSRDLREGLSALNEKRTPVFGNGGTTSQFDQGSSPRDLQE
jgi:enoyl-CoA hydratase